MLLATLCSNCYRVEMGCYSAVFECSCIFFSFLTNPQANLWPSLNCITLTFSIASIILLRQNRTTVCPFCQPHQPKARLYFVKNLGRYLICRIYLTALAERDCTGVALLALPRSHCSLQSLGGHFSNKHPHVPHQTYWIRIWGWDPDICIFNKHPQVIIMHSDRYWSPTCGLKILTFQQRRGLLEEVLHTLLQTKQFHF